MLNLPITDSRGQVLLITTAIRDHAFDAVTCSPRTDGGFGFSRLYHLLDKPYDLEALTAACAETVARDEVCVMPSQVSSRWRVLLTPTIRSREQGTRNRAARLMKDLFNASQAPGVEAIWLLITHFCYAIKYPEVHVAGILDALDGLKHDSFLRLRVLGFEVNGKHAA